MSKTKKWVLGFIGAVATHAVAAQAGNVLPLAESQASEVLTCAVSLATAQANLAARGYEVVSAAGDAGGDAFATQFKVSERDSTRRLLGSVAIERARRYDVKASGNSMVRFAPRYKETEFATGVLGHRADTVKEYAVPLTTATLETLKDMRREVCDAVTPAVAPGSNINSAAGPANLDLLQYLLDRCRAADERACLLLKAR